VKEDNNDYLPVASQSNKKIKTFSNPYSSRLGLVKQTRQGPLGSMQFKSRSGSMQENPSVSLSIEKEDDRFSGLGLKHTANSISKMDSGRLK